MLSESQTQKAVLSLKGRNLKMGVNQFLLFSPCVQGLLAIYNHVNEKKTLTLKKKKEEENRFFLFFFFLLLFLKKAY